MAGVGDSKKSRVARVRRAIGESEGYEVRKMTGARPCGTLQAP